MTPATDGMRLGLCLAAFGGTALQTVLAEVISYGPLSLDLPTDTTLGLGTLNWPVIVSTLIDEGYKNILYVEHEDALLPRRQSILRSLGLLREFLPGEAVEGRTW